MSKTSTTSNELSREKLDLLIRRLQDKNKAPATAERVPGEPPEEVPVALPRRPVDPGPAPLSFAQERLWVIDRMDPGSPAYVMAGAVTLEGRLRPRHLAAALGSLRQRHQSLRTTFREEGDGPVQVVHRRLRGRLPVVDLTGLPAARRPGEVRRAERQEVRRPFDLGRGPLLRTTLVRVSPRHHTLVVALHHIVSDGWSMGVLVGDLSELYRAGLQGGPPSLRPLDTQYADHAVLERHRASSGALEASTGFWLRELSGLPPLELPTDRPRRPGGPRPGRRLPIDLGPELGAAVRGLAVELGATPFMVLLAGFQLLLGRTAGQDDFGVGSPVANRHDGETEALIGLFVNTLVLRADLSGRPAFRELVRRVRARTLAALEHQEVPLERLVEELKPDRKLGSTPLFQTLFVLQNVPAGKLELPGLRLETEILDTGAAKFDLTLSLAEEEGGYRGTLEVDLGLFDETSALRLARRFRSLLVVGLAEPGAPVDELPLMAAEERHQVVTEWAPGPTVETPAQSLDGLVAERARRTPDAVAVAWRGGALTYGALLGRAEALAARLRALGVGPGARSEGRVAGFLDRSPEAVVGFLGTLRAGGTWVPLDPSHPDDWIQRLIEDADPVAVLTRGALEGPSTGLPVDGERVVRVDGGTEASPFERGGLQPAAGDRPAYVIYTSGTTGRPKGVPNTHRAVVNRLAWMQETFGLGADETVLQKAPLGFDFSVWEIFAPLALGGRLVLADSGAEGDPRILAALLDRERVTTVHFVPPMLQAFLDRAEAEAPGTLRRIFSGGDTLSVTLAARCTEAIPAPLYNQYGPTETAIDVACGPAATAPRPLRPRRDARAEPSGTVPIGRPAANTRLHVVDSELRPVPIGVPGELVVAGVQVAPGYLHRPALTAERFVPDPFVPFAEALSDSRSAGGGRIYRTGDRVRFLADGTLEHLGRLDRQVKVRGVRIEPAEVEEALRVHPAVRDAAVVARGQGVAGRLVAYVVVEEDAEALGEDVAELLRSRLPEAYMPSLVVPLDALPLTRNGKLDRRALAEREEGASRAAAWVPPATWEERAVAQAFAGALELDEGDRRVGAEDDFFELGGQSLLATRVVSRLRKILGVEVPLRRLFERRTVAGLARWIVEAAEDGDPERLPEAAPEAGGRARAGSAQRRLWFLDRLSPETALYTVAGLVELRGELRPPSLAGALTGVAHRHETLRTRFPASGGEPVPVVDPPNPVPLPLIDLSALPSAAGEEEGARLARAEARRPFDLAGGPLVRFRLLRLAPRLHRMTVVIHHVIADGWALGVLVREVAELYGAAVEGRPPRLPELPIQYREYIRRQEALLADGVEEDQLAYWRRRLEGLEDLDLPKDRPRPAVRSGRGGTVRAELLPTTTEGVRRLASAEGASPFMAFLALFHALLGRLTAREDLAVGTPVANRHRLESERLIGLLVNTLVLRGDLAGDPTVRELVARTRETTLEAQAHQDLPLERLVAALAPARELGRTPLFQVMLSFRETPRELPDLPGLGLTLRELDPGIAKFDLTLEAVDRGDRNALALTYDADLFDRSTARRLLERFVTLADAAVDTPDACIADLPWLSAGERHQVTREWRESAAGSLSDQEGDERLEDLVWAQAGRRPDAVAVKSAGEHLTFAGLRRRARTLAASLQPLLSGAGTETEPAVGVFLERSADAVVAFLAVLEAGGVFLPLDPAYPDERLGRMLADAGPAALVTRADLRPRLERLIGAPPGGELRLPPLVTVQEARGPVGGSADRAAPRHAASSLAYLIYTSGSSGRPKAVAVPHGAAAAHLRAAARRYRLRPDDGVLVFASLSFDIAIEEIGSGLAAGCRLEIWPSAEFSGGDLGRFLVERRLTVVNLPTAAWIQWMREGSSVPESCVGHGIRLVVVGGEVMPAASARRLGEVLRPRPALLNAYGPTEGVVTSTAHPVEAEGGDRVPIGRPLGTDRILLATPDLRAAGIGVPGEMLLGGPHLARGYLDRPAATAERFVPDPVAERAGARVYRTGDLVRWRSDGAVDFIGRRDGQVKVRGHRVELGEVEEVLAGLPRVDECAAVASGAPGRVRLVAFAVLDGAEDRTAAGRRLRAELAERLPEPMVPSVVEAVDAISRTPVGKIDRRALAARALDVLSGAGRERAGREPETATERAVAGVYARVLGVERVGADDGFFELGGHSLLATEAISELERELGVELPLRTLFQKPTVAALSAVVDRALVERTGVGRGAGAQRRTRVPARPTPLPGAERPEELPLSFAQERLWVLDRFDPGIAYNVPAAARLDGMLDRVALARSLAEVVRRHEALRTTFSEGTEGPVQRVHPSGELDGLPALPRIDLTALPGSRREDEALRSLGREARRPFDLDRGPLVRTALAVLGPERHVLAVTMHHIVSDGWSTGVFLRELSALYRAFAAGEPSPLEELPLQYADFALWQRRWLQGEVLEELLGAWRRRLEGLPALELPTDRPRPQRRSQRGGTVRFRFDDASAAGVGRLARSRGATPFMVLLSVFQALLGRYSGQRDLAVGTPIANRSRREIEALIGFFVNTLVLRGDLSDDPSLTELLAGTRRTTLDAYEHQDLPFERLVEELAPEREQGRTPLFQVMFVLQNAPLSLELGDLTLDPLELDTGTAKFDLVAVVHERFGGMAASLEYDADLFDRTTMERMGRHLRALLEGALADPHRPLDELPLLSSAERHQLLGEWAGAPTDYGRDRTLDDLFAGQVHRAPDAVAIVAGDRTLTYRALDALARGLARKLEAAGAGPERAVGLMMERSPELIAATLAVVRTGGYYVPLDPEYPAERLRFMLEDTAAPVVLVAPALAGRLDELLEESGGGGVEAIPVTFEGPDAAPDAPSSRSPSLPGPAGPRGLAYVMYTSGSTGRPKGVAVSHRAVVRLVRGTDYLQLGPEDRVAHLSNTAFDASTFELWGALATGAGMVAIDRETALDPARLVAELERRSVTALFLTTALFNQVVELAPSGFAPLRGVLFGGEAADPGAVRAALAAGGPEALINVYGPTENTTFSTWHRVEAVPEAAITVPIGGPVANSTVLVVDSGLRPVPAGVPGELCLSGDGLARGYLNRPARTARTFVPHPEPRAPGERLYRTGDLARWRPDGTIEFMGRLDAQVKIRGFRIEPGEVEAVLASHPRLAGSAVVVREDEPGDRRLVAYAVPADGGVGPDDLRTFLASRLPKYMVPSAFVLLDELPLDPNGKVDRKALPEPEPASGTAGEPVAPRTPTEELVAGAFTETLGLERVGIHDGFFDLGGHSLRATRLVSRLRETLGVELPLRALFEDPTVAGIARRADALSSSSSSSRPPVEPLAEDERRGGVPASFAQQRLWFLDRLEPGGADYNIPARLRLAGPADLPALARSLDRIVVRQEALRTRFEERAGEPVQVVVSAGRFPRSGRCRFPVVDLSSLPGGRDAAEAERIAAAEARRPFDLARGPLMRVTAVRREPAGHELLINLHHIVADGWSLGVFFRELSALYGNAGEDLLPPLPIQYGDFAVWQRRWLSGEALEEQLDYWRERLGGVPVLELPVDRRRPAGRARRSGSVPVRLGPERAEALARLGRRSGATVFMATLAAFQTLLARVCGQRDFAVGSPIANRTEGATEGLVGFFVNTLVLRSDLGPSEDLEAPERPRGFAGLLERVRETCLGAYAHQDVPFEKLVEELAPERRLDHTPLFQAFLSLQNADLELPELAGLEVDGEALDSGTTKFDLSLNLLERGDELVGSFDFDRELFDETTVRRLARRFGTLLGAAVAEPERPLDELALVPVEERHQVLREWGGEGLQLGLVGALAEGPALLLHERFEERAAELPDAAALVVGGHVLTYGELDRRSAALATRLRRLGAGPGVLVAVCMERTADLVVSLLAVLRSGAAYVPVDPAYPEERVELMLTDSGARVVLTAGEVSEHLPAPDGDGPEVLRVDRPPRSGAEDAGREAPAASAPRAAAPSDLAYVIYTSGSTGRPKGVSIEHRSASALLAWARELFPPEDLAGMLAATSVCFDLSVFELFLPLSFGGRVILADDALALADLPAAGRVTLLNTVPSAATELARLEAIPPSVRTVNLAGEPLQRSLVDRVYATSRAARVLNLYGPSEDTTYSTWDRVERGVPAEPTIGRPLNGTRAYLLGPDARPVPAGTPGELHLGGAGLSRGYLGRPALTAERYVPDPYGGGDGQRLYRTGDLARHLPDGRLELLGRIDHQVKVRGFRIELGEVEAALASHPAMERCAVLVVGRGSEDGDRGGSRLAAFVEAVPGAEELPAAAELGEHLRERLPAVMVPSTFTVVDALPLTPNGKIDRRALAEQAETTGTGGRAVRLGTDVPYTAPRTPVEELLAGLWSALLEVESVGVHDDFFALGGHSLQVTRLVSRIREELGVEVPLRQVFETPTIAELAGRLEDFAESDAPSLERIAARRRGDELPTTFSQRRLWFLDRLDPGSSRYNIPARLALSGPADIPALARALARIVERHETLRTTLVERGGEPVQLVAPPPPTALPVVDLSRLGTAGAECETDRLGRAEASRPFDLARGPLARWFAVRRGPERHDLVVNLHHAIADGWSLGVFLRELALLYRSAERSAPTELPELPVQYGEFADWQRRWLSGERLERQLAYWREQLEGVPVLELPIDRRRPAGRPRTEGHVRFELGPEVVAALRRYCRSDGVTPFMVLLAAYEALLARISGQRDFAVGTPVANRSWQEVEGLIGFFVNTLAVRSSLADRFDPAESAERGEDGHREPTFRELVARVREATLDAQTHQDLPFEKLVEELAPDRRAEHTPIFQAFFTLQTDGLTAPDLAGLESRTEVLRSGEAKYDLGLSLADGGEPEGALEAGLSYDAEQIDPDTAASLARCFEVLVEEALADPDRRVDRIPLAGREERVRLLGSDAGERRELPREATVGELFRRVAGERPDAPAVELGTDRVTYGELAGRSTRLAARLVARGVGPGTVVGVCCGRSTELILACLAVAEAGGVYLPLAPAYPEERLGWMVEDSGARLVLTRAEDRVALPEALPEIVEVLDLDDPVPASEAVPENPAPPVGAGDPVYVIYTSGSTGRPKGVMVHHRAVVRLVCGTDYLQIGPDDRLTHLSNPAFDAAIFEIWGALLNGATLVALDEETAVDPPRLARAVAARRVTVLFLTTALLNRVVYDAPETFSGPRAVLFGGESADPAAVRRLLAGPRPERLLHLYGPTENTTYSTWHEVTSIPPGAVTVPIGRALANSTAYVVDGHLEPVPSPVLGELLVGGEGIALGYLGRPALTAERFVPDPFAHRPGARLYRTGDLVRRRPGGAIDFVGRADDQVKIRGFRIEPGEVEAALAEHPGLDRAVVVVREDEPGDKRLVAYAVAAGDAEVTTDELRRLVERRVPGYMVPSAFVLLDELPLNANGKVDRRALPAPVPEAVSGADWVAPRNPVEETLAEVWADLLGMERVGVHDDFFSLGGHSLKATRLISRVRETFGVEVPLRRLFEAPTVAALAETVTALRDAADETGAPPLRPRTDTGPAPLSYSQERLWILDRFEPDNSAYGMPFAVRLTGDLDVPALARALAGVVARHEALRTVFGTRDGRPVQVVLPPGPPALPAVDLRGLSGPDKGEALEALLRAEGARSFDLAEGPLVRMALALEEDGVAVLHVTMHHIVSDGWSLGIFIREMTALYRAATGEREAEEALSALPVQYPDYAEWQRRWLSGETRRRQLDYWGERLAGVPQGLELPLDRPRPAVRSFRGDSRSARLEADLVGRLRSLAVTEGSSLFMVLLAGWKLLLQRLSGERDVVVGSPVAGRDRREVEGLIGMFLNTLVLRTDVSGDPPFRELLDRVRRTALGSYEHQDVPFEMLLEELNPERDLSRTPFFQIFFNMLELPIEEEVDLPGLTLEALTLPDAPSKFDVTLYLRPRAGGIELHAVFNADLFDGATVERFLGQYRTVLDQAVGRPDGPISSVHLLDEAARPAVAGLLPDPAAELSAAWEGPIHGALRRAAAETPDRRAVVDRDGAWTYAAVDAWSDDVARCLGSLGVTTGDRVTIYGHRSASLVAAVFGTLKAGAAFVVLDPAYPPRRLAETVEAADPAALVRLEAAGTVPEEVLAGPGRPVLDLAPVPGRAASEAPADPPEVDVGPDDTAYVAFTSGSTGRPKGIVGRHGSLTHFLPWQCERFGLGPEDRFTMLSGLAHDPLQRDLFTPVWLGATLVVPDPGDMGTPERLRRWLDREGATVAHLTPAMGQVLTDRGPGARRDVEAVASLRRVFLVGDVLTRRDVERLRRLAPRVGVVNMYGSTETQRAVGYHEVPESPVAGGPGPARSKEVLPLGEGMRDAQLLVLDPGGELAAIGEVGEIAVRSPHLALGYLDDPERTAERFVTNPFTGRRGDRLFRTGDLGRYDARGQVHFLGRADQQVKIRGFRIELGEIVSHLSGAPGVRDAAVLPRSDGPLGERLTGYVVPDSEPASLDALRRHLRERLPAYMVPATWVLLEELPLTPNRKLDRRALLAMDDRSREETVSTRGPANEAERKIAAIVEDVLGLDGVDVEDNFFELGGNSLLLVQVHGRLQETFGREIAMVELFNHPSVRSLARFLGVEDGDETAPRERRDEQRSERLREGRNRLQRRRRRRSG